MPPFECQKCGACCRIKNGIVRVSDEEIKRIAAFLGKDETSFIAEDTELAPDRRGLVLKSRPDGACAWLSSDNLCRINPVKPDKCRTFPQEWRNSDSADICPALAAVERLSFVSLRDRPEMMQTAANWFHEKWHVPTEAYLACMTAYLGQGTEYGWYLCLDGDRIVGGLGVIENDFHDRKDLSPNVCAVYTEEAYRGRGIAGRLLNMVVVDMKGKGISPLYLLTDHTGFYERYGWEFLCMAQGDGEEKMSRMYVHYGRLTP